MKTENKENNAPRFGWTRSIDLDPQLVWERRAAMGMDKVRRGFPPLGTRRAVAVIPLPYDSAKMRAKVKALAAELWPKE